MPDSHWLNRQPLCVNSLEILIFRELFSTVASKNIGTVKFFFTICLCWPLFLIWFNYTYHIIANITSPGGTFFYMSENMRVFISECFQSLKTQGNFILCPIWYFLFSFLCFKVKTEHLESNITGITFLHLYILFENILMKTWLKKHERIFTPRRKMAFSPKKFLFRQSEKQQSNINTKPILLFPITWIVFNIKKCS